MLEGDRLIGPLEDSREHDQQRLEDGTAVCGTRPIARATPGERIGRGQLSSSDGIGTVGHGLDRRRPLEG